MAKAQKSRASKLRYLSPSVVPLPGFETPFDQHLDKNNRWVKLAQLIPWDSIVNIYLSKLKNQKLGADSINPRVVIGAMIIKHINDFSDRETVLQIQENVYMQYFIGFSSFSNQAPFDASLFVEFRNRLGPEDINKINEKIVKIYQQSIDESSEDGNIKNDTVEHKDKSEAIPPEVSVPTQDDVTQSTTVSDEVEKVNVIRDKKVELRGSLIMDATVCPQEIAYPTDLDLLNESREQSEKLIDGLMDYIREWTALKIKKPRTYRKVARTHYLKIAQKKTRSRSEIRKGIRQQLQYLKRNIKHLHWLLDQIGVIVFDKKAYKYFLVIQHLYDQQKTMYDTKTHSIENRIVSIHQPHVRPIKRGKKNSDTEFGAKIQSSLMDGFVFIDELNWEAFNEGTRLKLSVENYKRRLGYYPQKVLADKIYCTRENRNFLKEMGIELRAKPLGRPKALSNQVRPGERNPIEGKFGQAKRGYGLDKIRAKLASTSESWISTIILVLNLVKLAGTALYCLTQSIVKHFKQWCTLQVNQLLLILLSMVQPRKYWGSG
ncbi:MAG: IS5 family transposase [Saprospiraceae bacterium]|nr:IS5 family transposase [Saprospiraceae bacterium]